MSVLQASRSLETSRRYFITRAPWWRPLALATLLALSLAIYLELAHNSPADATAINVNRYDLRVALTWPYMLCFLPYMAACALVFCTRPVRGRWLEFGLIFGGAALLRALLLPFPPNLSRDSWRYVWDARVLLHGYSPYVYAPGDSVLAHLAPAHDFIFSNSRYRTVPSLYPPGAEFIYALSYVLAPSNLYVLKGVFAAFDLASCVVLAKLLARKGLDPARAILYAWCPLPIIEFALQGHVDALPITFVLLAALTADDTSWRGRGLTGFLIGMGTLTKLYPILMLVPATRLRAWRRDWLLVLACLLTIIAGYLPFYIQGHGQIFGFFGIYSSEQGTNAGFIQLAVAWFSASRHLSLPTTIELEHLAAFLLLGGVSLAVWLLRQRERISLEAGVLLLFGLVLAVSSHVFPWYTATLLPWIALLLPAQGQRTGWLLVMARLLTLCAIWLFACLSVLSYVEDWPSYYLTVYYPLLVELLLAAFIALSSYFPCLRQKGTTFAKRQSKPLA